MFSWFRNTGVQQEYSVKSHVLGKGSCSKVFLGKHKKTRQEVAVKKIAKKLVEEDDQAKVERETAAMRLLAHPACLAL
eukprot:CAMPEP_0172155154 /NCGR_PEP_ID=MMETSP1050-20130122/2460_1 /TAXON_ID=233186 /ORGANISM="Cryptomonas curvata, Strain CCAP979/52" /LENGTH=77 /DNA_ID=CAMNT_0012824005 /DNA_START=56 /DNA_END=286 /DNA_ORIENTATION=-